MKYLLWVVVLLFCPLSSLAAGEFHTKFNVTYTFDYSGQSRINQEITLTNLLSQVYATEYRISTAEDLKNVSGSDALGPLVITTSKSGSTSDINIKFNDQVVGKGNSLTFDLNFDGQPATHNGQVWEVILPRLASPDTIDDYTMNLVVPSSFGTPAFISPKPLSSRGTAYTFSKEQMVKAGVVAAFGNFQTFGFNLTYHLENPESDPVYTEIALPADTSYQRVFYDSIVPPPLAVRVDQDGNWLARYDLDPGQLFSVVATGQAHLLPEPSHILPVGDITTLTDYLQSTQYWQVNDPQIQRLAKELKTPEAIYNYVVDKLTYDYSRVKPGNTRQGAVQALSNPTSAVCTEFTDLFIAIARAAGIPAREVNGYAYTTDSAIRPLSLVSDILHAWPQYWDASRRLWINIDPTWGNTTGGVDYFHKLDFNHFAFVTHGVEDERPLAAGLYKTAANTRDVRVEFTAYKEYPLETLGVEWQAPWQILPFVPVRSQLFLTNTSGQALYDTQLSIVSEKLPLVANVNAQLPVIPPYGEHRQELTFAPSIWFGLGAKTLDIKLNSEAIGYNIPDRLFLAWQASLVCVAALTIIGLALIATRAWSIYLQKRLRRDALRGQGQKP